MEIIFLLLVPFALLWLNYIITECKVAYEDDVNKVIKIRARADATLPVKAVIAVLISVTGYYLYDEYITDEKIKAKEKAARDEIARRRLDEINKPLYEAARARQAHDDKLKFMATDAKARAGDPSAAYELGNLFEQGIGTSRDLRQAIDCWGAAAIHGHGRALIKLGDLFSTGDKGLPRNLMRAAEMYRRAARQGDLVGLQRMGECYLNGLGVVQDDVEAYAYFVLVSIRTGNRSSAATSFLKRMVGQGAPIEVLEGRMTKEQMAEGARRAKELQVEIDSY